MPPSNITQIVWWEFLDGEELTMTELPLEPNLPQLRPGMIVSIDAVGGNLRYAINGVASAAAHGFVPENGARIIGPLSNWASLSLYGTAGVLACIAYYRENVRG